MWDSNLKQCRTQEGGGGTLSWSWFNEAIGLVTPLRRQICPNPVWLCGLRPCGFPALSLGPFGLAMRALRDSDKFGSSRRDQTSWLGWIIWENKSPPGVYFRKYGIFPWKFINLLVPIHDPCTWGFSVTLYVVFRLSESSIRKYSLFFKVFFRRAFLIQNAQCLKYTWAFIILTVPTSHTS